MNASTFTISDRLTAISGDVEAVDGLSLREGKRVLVDGVPMSVLTVYLFEDGTKHGLPRSAWLCVDGQRKAVRFTAYYKRGSIVLAGWKRDGKGEPVTVANDGAVA